MRAGSSKYQVEVLLNTTSSGPAKIIDVRKSGALASDVTYRVKFLNTGYCMWIDHQQVSHKRFRDPMKITVGGVGYIGGITHTSKTQVVLYKRWRGMLERIHGKRHNVKYRSYLDCTIHQRWYSFHNFVEDAQKIAHWNEPSFQMDKDLRVLGNREYGPKTVSFVPAEVNGFMRDYHGKNSTGLPPGVQKVKNRFVVNTPWSSVRTHGSHLRLEDAVTDYQRRFAAKGASLARKYKPYLSRQLHANLANLHKRLFGMSDDDLAFEE